MPMTLAMFDMAATSVDDTIDGRPLVLQSFAESFAAAQVRVPWEELNSQRGKDKEVFRILPTSYGGLHGTSLEHTTQELLQYFTAQLLRNIKRLQEMPGATAAFTLLPWPRARTRLRLSPRPVPLPCCRPSRRCLTPL